MWVYLMLPENVSLTPLSSDTPRGGGIIFPPFWCCVLDNWSQCLGQHWRRWKIIVCAGLLSGTQSCVWDSIWCCSKGKPCKPSYYSVSCGSHLDRGTATSTSGFKVRFTVTGSSLHLFRDKTGGRKAYCYLGCQQPGQKLPSQWHSTLHWISWSSLLLYF